MKMRRETSSTTGSDLSSRERAVGIAALPPAGSAEQLATRYGEVRGASEALAAPLSEEDCVVQSMEDASPVKWHLAHTTWFFETFVVAPALSSYPIFDEHFRVLFNSYYNAVGEQHPRPERGLLSRPSLAEVRRYRAHVDRHLLELLGSDGAAQREHRALIELGLHHEQQHQELTLTDLKHMLSCNPLRPAYREASHETAVEAKSVQWYGYEGGLCWIGDSGAGFAFDNERPRHRIFQQPFEIASRPVTNGEFLAFMSDGGYERPVCVDEPVCHVSHYEADAYARWAGARLPTEAEWEIAAADAPIEGNLVETGRLHPNAAAVPPTEGWPGQLFGDVWEWTQSAYAPYPGFSPPDGAVGEYNGKFMCNQMVLRGGSCATPASHLRRSYRNFFPSGARWQFSGIRLARDAS